MTNPTIQQNVIPTDPDMKDLLNIFKKDIMINLNCHHIGTIQSFDATKQTATATINYKKTFFNYNENSGEYTASLRDYPLLMDCPAIVLGGGSTALTFPITSGDECLVIFNDRNLDNWLLSGGGQGVASPRLHSFSDGIVLVGIRSTPKFLSGYDTARAVIRGPNSGAVGVNATSGKAFISKSGTTLNTLLQNLITAIEAITVSTVVDGTPTTSTPPLNAASFVSIATQIGNLLE